MAIALTITLLAAAQPAAPSYASVTDGGGDETRLDLGTAPPWADPTARSTIEAAHDIQDFVNGLGSRGEGFTSLRAFRSQGLVELYWKDEPPQSLVTYIAELEHATQSLSIRVLRSRFALRELEAEIRRLIEIPVVELGGKLVKISPSRDGFRLELTVDSEEDVAAVATNLRFNDIPVTVTSGTAPLPVPGRFDDSPPFYGGGVIESSNFFCSVAFAARDAQGNDSMLSAKHCGTSRAWFAGFSFRYFGDADGGLSGRDAMLISGLTYAERVFRGPFNTADSIAVKGLRTPVVGDWAETSGGFSGTDIWSDVTKVRQWHNLPGIGWSGPMFQTDNVQGVASVGSGDSGGPVMTYGPSPGGHRAMGIISAVDTRHSGPCIGVQNPDRVCSTRAYHANLDDALSAYGLTLKTG